MEAPLQNLYCEIHQKRQVQFIDLSKDPEDKNRFYCSKCLMTRLNSNMKDSGLVDVQDLINKDPVQDIMNWPKIEDDNLRKIQEEIQITDINEEKTKMIQNFIETFTKYQKNFIQECQQIQKNTIVGFEKYFARKEEDIKSYQKIKLDSFYNLEILLDSFDNVNIIDKPTEEKNLYLDKYIQEVKALEEQLVQEQRNLEYLTQDMFSPIQCQFTYQVNNEIQLFINNIKQMKFMKTDILKQVPMKNIFYFPVVFKKTIILVSSIFPVQQTLKFETEFICQTPFKENDDYFSFQITEYDKNKPTYTVASINWYAKSKFKSKTQFQYTNNEDIKIFGDIYKGNNEKIKMLFEICPQKGILIIKDSNNKYCLLFDQKPFKQWDFRFLWNKYKQYSFNIKNIQ